MKNIKRQDEQAVPVQKKDGIGHCTPSAPTGIQVSKIPTYRNTVRDSYRLGDGTEIAIFYPQAVRSSDEEKQNSEPVD